MGWMKPGPRTDDPWNAHHFPGRGGPGGIKIHTRRLRKKDKAKMLKRQYFHLALLVTVKGPTRQNFDFLRSRESRPLSEIPILCFSVHHRCTIEINQISQNGDKDSQYSQGKEHI
jgi:hypothetical protein